MSATVVFLHAHPDDETLLTGGTIAQLSANGVRVIVVTATDGAAGLASSEAIASESLSSVRGQELDLATRILGVHKVVSLGYADSGLDGMGGSSMNAGEGNSPNYAHQVDASNEIFVKVALDQVADRVAALLEEWNPDVIVGYDPSGGYGHPDHIRVHELGRAVAQKTGIRLLEASLPREPYAAVANVIRNLAKYVPVLNKVDVASWESAYLPRRELYVRVDAKNQAMTKRAALRAHASQGTGGPRTISIMRAIPVDLYAMLFGVEWYAYPILDNGIWEYQLAPDGQPFDDVLSVMR